MELYIDRNTLIRNAWVTGNLEYLSYEYQNPVYTALWDAINNKKVLKYALNISRRFGKTFVASIVAVEYAIKFPGSIINYAAPTGKEMNKILRSMMPVILADCPTDLKPTRRNGTWEFPNGSIIYTAGVNAQHADDLRGNKADLNIVDEAGQVDELEYLVSSVLLPMQLTTGGTLLLLSTPPSATDHDFSRMFHDCEEEGNALTLTVHDNALAMADETVLETWAKEYGGVNSTAWRREFLCEWVTDTNKIIMPEWGECKSTCTVTPAVNNKFKFWKKYVAMDLGFKDFTCLIYAYYDFERAKLVVQDELILVGEEVTSAAIALGTLEIEEKLWGIDSNPKRIADNSDNIVLNDINRVHGVLFNPTSKDSLMAMVNATRTWIAEGKLEISENCKYLLGCLEFGVWNKNRDKFGTSKKFGHYDGLAALIYMLRYVDEFTNPVPAMFGLKQDDVYYNEPKKSVNYDGLSQFNLKRKRANGVT